MIKAFVEFNELFTKWFKILIEDESLNIMNPEIPSIDTENKSEQGPDKEAVEETTEEQDMDLTVEGSVEDAEDFGMQNHIEAINSIISQYEPRLEEADKKTERHTRGAKGYAKDWPSVYAYDHSSMQWHEKHKTAVFGAKAVMGATVALTVAHL